MFQQTFTHFRSFVLCLHWVHLDFCTPCQQRDPPWHCLQNRRWWLWTHMALPPHSLHVSLRLPWTHTYLIRFPGLFRGLQRQKPPSPNINGTPCILGSSTVCFWLLSRPHCTTCFLISDWDNWGMTIIGFSWSGSSTLSWGLAATLSVKTWQVRQQPMQPQLRLLTSIIIHSTVTIMFQILSTSWLVSTAPSPTAATAPPSPQAPWFILIYVYIHSASIPCTLHHHHHHQHHQRERYEFNTRCSWWMHSISIINNKMSYLVLWSCSFSSHFV